MSLFPNEPQIPGVLKMATKGKINLFTSMATSSQSSSSPSALALASHWFSAWQNQDIIKVTRYMA